MLKGLCVPTGELIGAELLAEVHASPCSGIRIKADHLPALPESYVVTLAREVIAAQMQPYTSIRTAEQFTALTLDAPGALVGLGNEPYFKENRWTFDGYVHEAKRCLAFSKEAGVPIYLGEIANLNLDGFDWFSALLNALKGHLHEFVRFSAHRYPNDKPTTPHKGFTSREHEVDYWRRMIMKACGEPRPLLIGEVGYNNKTFSEAAAADYMAWEARFWNEQGIDFVFAYQINDGPTSHVLDSYGFRRLDGSWKPVKDAFFQEAA